jgi:hypothetical protein
MRRLTFGLALSAAVVLATQASALGAGTPRVGTGAVDADLRSVPGTVAYGGGHAVPLQAAVPEWYTPALHQQVLADGGRPVAAPAQAPLPSEIGIRPGAWMLFPSGCTMNFIFRSGSSYAIGTAGHCVSRVGEPVTLLTLAPGTSNPVLVNVGNVLKRADGGIGNDFALVSVNPVLNSWVDPTIAVIGGPCGQFGGSGIQTVFHYGHGLVIGTGGTSRAGVATTWQSNMFGWDGAAIFGDSGSPVRIGTLPAAGNLTHLVVDSRYLPSFIAGTRISRILQIAGGWSLVSSSLCL